MFCEFYCKSLAWKWEILLEIQAKIDRNSYEAGCALPYQQKRKIHTLYARIMNETLNLNSLNISFRSCEKIEMKENNFTFINILDGTSMQRAQELCNEKGMQLFEPRDATINHMVWEKARENYPLVRGYWLNIKRRTEDPM